MLHHTTEIHYNFSVAKWVTFSNELFSVSICLKRKIITSRCSIHFNRGHLLKMALSFKAEVRRSRCKMMQDKLSAVLNQCKSTEKKPGIASYILYFKARDLCQFTRDKDPSSEQTKILSLKKSINRSCLHAQSHQVAPYYSHGAAELRRGLSITLCGTNKFNLGAY